jgi:hypothetical protein
MPTNTLYPMELELTEPPDKFIGEAVVLDVCPQFKMGTELQVRIWKSI